MSNGTAGSSDFFNLAPDPTPQHRFFSDRAVASAWTKWPPMSRETSPTDRTFRALEKAAAGMSGRTDQTLRGKREETSWPTPRQLPADIDGFTDRNAVLEALERVFDSSPKSASVSVAVLVGTAGVGKTAVAIHWGHGVQGRFPDGTLYVNLRGFDPSNTPLRPEEALSQAIRSVGLQGHPLPQSIEERSALFRSITAGQRLLVILDNAFTAEQVRPLILSSPASMIVVTSRNSLSGLVARDGATRIAVPVLSMQDSEFLLEKLIGERRFVPTTARHVADRCARLPLALRVAAETLARSEFRTMADTLEELENGQEALDSLNLPGDEASNVKSVFSWSYRSLTAPSARAFRLLALHPGSTITLASAAALLGEGRATTRRLLSELTEAHLLEEANRERFRFHDLLRAYAMDRATTEEDVTAKKEAVTRVLVWYLTAADVANRLLAPHRRHAALPATPVGVELLALTDYESAMIWCESERLNLVDAVRLAMREGFLDLAWRLPAALFSFFYIRWYSDDWIETHKLGAEAAERIDSTEGRSLMVNRLGVAYKEQGLFTEALPRFREALELRRLLTDDQGVATALTNIGLCLTGLGRPAESVRLYEEALQISRRIGDNWTVSWTLHNLGEAKIALNDLSGALGAQQESLEVSDRIGDKIIRGDALRQLGEIRDAMADYDEAMQQHERALRVCRELGYRATEARVLSNVGKTLWHLGRMKDSGDAYRDSVVLSENVGDRFGAARTMTIWAEGLAQGTEVEVTEARRLLSEAAAVFRDLGAEIEAQVLDQLQSLTQS